MILVPQQITTIQRTALLASQASRKQVQSALLVKHQLNHLHQEKTNLFRAVHHQKSLTQTQINAHALL